MRPSRQSHLTRIAAATLCAAAPFLVAADTPFRGLRPSIPREESFAQVGVRSEIRPGSCTYVYTVLSRHHNRVAGLQIGYDVERGVCELTGAPPRAQASVRIEVEDRDAMTVALALWHSSDYVKIVHNDGSEAFLGMHKIRAIWDADGVDRTKDVLEKRKSVGTAPPGYQETPKQSTGKGLRNVLGVAVLVSLTAIVIMAATGGPQF